MLKLLPKHVAYLYIKENDKGTIKSWRASLLKTAVYIPELVKQAKVSLVICFS